MDTNMIESIYVIEKIKCLLARENDTIDKYCLNRVKQSLGKVLLYRVHFSVDGRLMTKVS